MKTTFMPRAPRHEVNEESKFKIEVERTRDGSRIPCVLCNVSRNGCQTQAEEALDEGEAVRIHIRLEQIGFETPIDAVVRWVGEQSSSGVTLGFRFAEPAPLEVIGELILLGVIDDSE